jgi:hypothetical protein
MLCPDVVSCVYHAIILDLPVWALEVIFLV